MEKKAARPIRGGRRSVPKSLAEFAAYRRQTLRGFFDELTNAGDAAHPGGVFCVCAGGKGCYDCFTEGFSFSAMTHSTTVRAMSGRV